MIGSPDRCRSALRRPTCTFLLNDPEPPQSDLVNPLQGVVLMLKFLGSTIGIIFLIGLLVVIGLFALVF